MTIVRDPFDNGAAKLRTVGCALCGVPLREMQGAADHLPNCPARPAYAERWALQDGGPEPEAVRAAIRESISPASELAADGGNEGAQSALPLPPPPPPVDTLAELNESG